MNAADIIIAVCLVFFTWLGYKRGFIHSLLDLFRWAGAFVTAALLYHDATGILIQYFSVKEEWQQPASFLVVFVAALFFLWLLFAVIKKITPAAVQYSFANKAAGLIPGFLTGVAVSLLLAKILVASIWFATPAKENNTILLSSFSNATGWLDDRMKPVFSIPVPPQVSGAAEIAYSESEEFKSASFQSRPDLEARLLQLVNTERKTRGIRLLLPDNLLRTAAENHAADMFTRGYFSHNTPEGTDPFQRMKKTGIRYTAAGENLAHAYTLDAAHTGLMNSPGHKANILNKQFGKIGIAVLDGGEKGLMLVQEFSN